MRKLLSRVAVVLILPFFAVASLLFLVALVIAAATGWWDGVIRPQEPSRPGRKPSAAKEAGGAALAVAWFVFVVVARLGYDPA